MKLSCLPSETESDVLPFEIKRSSEMQTADRIENGCKYTYYLIKSCIKKKLLKRSEPVSMSVR